MVTLTRFAYTERGTFGKLLIPALDLAWDTVERPWLNNKQFESCIPCDTYEMRMGVHKPNGPNPYPVYELQNVPGRSQIEIHIANYCKQVHGCIGIGKGLGIIHGQWAVQYSTMSFHEFMDAMAGTDPAHITIRNAEGQGVLV